MNPVIGIVFIGNEIEQRALTPEEQVFVVATMQQIHDMFYGGTKYGSKPLLSEEFDNGVITVKLLRFKPDDEWDEHNYCGALRGAFLQKLLFSLNNNKIKINMREPNPLQYHIVIESKSSDSGTHFLLELARLGGGHQGLSSSS